VRASGLALLAVLACAATASAQSPPSPVVIAGTGEEAGSDDRGDGGLATAAAFDGVDGLDWAEDGSILVADNDDGRIRRITPGGNIETNMDPGLANAPDEPMAVFSTGWQPADHFQRHSFVTSDFGDSRVEVCTLSASPFLWSCGAVADQDIVATDVENSEFGFYAADEPAGIVYHIWFNDFLVRYQVDPSLEGLSSPEGIGPAPGGGYLVATKDGDCVIRRRAGAITDIVAGRAGGCLGVPEAGPQGDGAPATDAMLHHPTDAEGTPDGGFVIAERYWLRRVAPDGTISTLFQNDPFLPEPFPPPSEITALEVTPDGDVLIGLSRQVLRFDTNYAPAQDPGPQDPGPSTTGSSNAGTTNAGATDLGSGSGSSVAAISQVKAKAALSGVTVTALCQAVSGCMLGATGVISIPKPALSTAFRLKRAKPRFVASGQRARLTLKLSGKTRKSVDKALKKKRFRRKVKAKITVTDSSTPGSSTSVKKSVRFRR
jgi:hypothetical protein